MFITKCKQRGIFTKIYVPFSKISSVKENVQNIYIVLDYYNIISYIYDIGL